MKKATGKDTGIDTLGGLGPLSSEEELALRTYFAQRKQERQAELAKKKPA